MPVFSRPLPAARSRSRTTYISSSGVDTLPLTTDGSSISGGSQSSIDLTSTRYWRIPHIFQCPILAQRGRGRGFAPVDKVTVVDTRPGYHDAQCTKQLRKRQMFHLAVLYVL